jgi:hypothetical protein
MPSFAEIAAALFGAWRLAHLDKSGLQAFDFSVAGAYKSFFAAVIVAPGYFLLLMLVYAERSIEAPLAMIVPMVAGGYVILWVLFPLVAHSLLNGLAMGQRFIPLLVAYNWAQCLVVYAILPIAAVSASGMLGGFGQLLSFLMQIFIAPAYLWFVMRTALQGNGHIAFGLLMLTIFLELAVMLVVESRLGIVGP